MRDFLKSSGRWLSVGWFWPLVLLALPDCSTLADADPWPRGSEPKTSAVMCDIPKPFTTQCADPSELGVNVSTTQAAVALATGQSSVNNLALDYANQCRDGLPMRTEFFGPYPEGFQACLNCGDQIPAPFPDGNAVCVAQCKELLASDGEPDPPEGIDAFCQGNAHVSTNFDKTMCFHGVCTRDGVALAFNDRRRDPELVKWIVIVPDDGTEASDNNLTRIKPTTDTNSDAGFDAGSEAMQVIEKGDAWIEFAAGDAPDETSLSHVLGVSNCPSPCDTNNPPPDTDRSLNDIQFMISLNKDGFVYVIENPGLIIHGPFDPSYDTGELFRVKIVDNHDGTTATISYQRSCTPNTSCDGHEFFTSVSPATYPLRIDTSFREQNASLVNVTVVRIQ